MRIKSEVTVVTERGQTSIPSRLRKAMALSKGKQLVWERISDTEIRVRVLSKRKADPISMLGFAKRFRRTRRSSAWMAELRAGEK